MNNCKTCVYWLPMKQSVKGECDFVNTMGADRVPDKSFEVEATADDDSNMQVRVITGENFGCLHYLTKHQNYLENQNNEIL